MGIIILLVILAIAALFLLIVPIRWTTTSGYARETVHHRLSRLWALIPIVAILLTSLTFGVSTVQAKHVGVKTTFGKVAKEPLPSGLHWKAPWSKVTELDSTIQTWEYAGKSAIDVVLADKNEATVSATIRWSVNDDKANDVFAEFRTADDGPTDGLGDAVVGTQFKAALWSVFDDHDVVAADALTSSELADKVKEAVEANTRGLVVIESVTISKIVPGEKLQSKIEDIQAQVSQTTIATEKKETAKQEAAANRILSESISNDPNVLVSKCLDLLADGVTLPTGFQCWDNTGGAVVVPSAK